MKLKKIVAAVMAAALMAACAVPASAATAKTNTYYVNQEKTYGKLTLTSSKLTASTYCEYTSAGRIVKARYWYNNGSEVVKKEINLVGNYDNDVYVYSPGSTTASSSKTFSSGNTYTKAKSFHKVEITSYITWDNAACEGDTNGKDIPFIKL